MAQTQTIDFRSLLKQNSKTVSRPQSAPDCWLIGTIGQFVHETLKTGTEKISFDLSDIEAHPETEEGLLDNINLKNLRSPYSKCLNVTYWITENALYHLTDMLDRVVGDPDRLVEERLPEVKGLRVMFRVSRVEVDGKDTGQNEVDGRTLALAEAA
jgi:hypothetical protein